jgi:ABC-type transporter Mla MlaB component
MSIPISFRRDKEITILELSGRLFGAELEEVDKEVENYLTGQKNVPSVNSGVSPPNPKLIVDLSRVEHIGSRGIAMLLTFAKKYQVKLAAPRALVRNALNLLGINCILEIYETVDEAIKRFR